MATKKEKTTAVVTRVQHPNGRSPEQSIELIRSCLDKLEVVQMQHTAGSIFIGLELLAIKDQLGRGEFMNVFHKQIERPRFAYRTATRYMADAHRVKQTMLKNGSVNLAGILNIAPSALPMERQRELQKIITQAVGDRTMTGLRGALGADQPRAPKQLAADAPTGKEAEMKAHIEVWEELCQQFARELSRKTWRFLDPDVRKKARKVLELALSEIPE